MYTTDAAKTLECGDAQEEHLVVQLRPSMVDMSADERLAANKARSDSTDAAGHIRAAVARGIRLHKITILPPANTGGSHFKKFAV